MSVSSSKPCLKSFRMYILVRVSSAHMSINQLSFSFAETMGYAFTYPALRSLTPSNPNLPRNAPGWRNPIPIIAYIHYPTISSSMLKRVSAREAGVTNSGMVARSSILSLGKLMYVISPPCIDSTQHASITGIITSSPHSTPTPFQLIAPFSSPIHLGQKVMSTPSSPSLLLRYRDCCPRSAPSLGNEAPPKESKNHRNISPWSVVDKLE